MSNWLDDPAWTISTRQEVIAVLWLIAALLAESHGYPWLAVALYAKAGVDMLGAVKAARRRR